MTELNSFVNPEFLEDLEFIAVACSRVNPSVHTVEGVDPASNFVLGSNVEQSHLNQILEQACNLTGATGGAIALGRGNELVCRATTGSQAPDLGVQIDPHTGLSGSCVQTRQLQQSTDTETDSRVDPEACRQLGVKSIVVLPLTRGDELLGVFEVFSSRPNAFGHAELESLQTLADRILPVGERHGRIAARVSVPATQIKEEINENNTHGAKSDSKRQHIWNVVLGVFVIGLAMLLGAVVGWRLGWQNAIVQLRDHSVLHRSRATSKNILPDKTSAGPSPGSRASEGSQQGEGQGTSP